MLVICGDQYIQRKGDFDFHLFIFSWADKDSECVIEWIDSFYEAVTEEYRETSSEKTLDIHNSPTFKLLSAVMQFNAEEARKKNNSCLVEREELKHELKSDDDDSSSETDNEDDSFLDNR
jgi:hypothetical protein